MQPFLIDKVNLNRENRIMRLNKTQKKVMAETFTNIAAGSFIVGVISPLFNINIEIISLIASIMLGTFLFLLFIIVGLAMVK